VIVVVDVEVVVVDAVVIMVIDVLVVVDSSWTWYSLFLLLSWSSKWPHDAMALMVVGQRSETLRA
jgi:hypothetical protein